MSNPRSAKQNNSDDFASSLRDSQLDGYFNPKNSNAYKYHGLFIKIHRKDKSENFEFRSSDMHHWGQVFV